MSLSVPSRTLAVLAAATSGLSAVLGAATVSTASATTASSSVSMSAASAAATSDWFVDPRTPAQRRAEVRVPRDLSDYHGDLVETRAAYRTRASHLAVPMRFAFGHKIARGQAVTLDGHGLFVVNKTRLTAGAENQLTRLARSLGDASSIRCEGYADYAGRAARNRYLARGRAAAVCDALVAKSAKGLKATKVGYGPTRPALVGGSWQDRSFNRRVVVEMTGTRSIDDAKVPGPPVLRYVYGWDGGVYYGYDKPLDDGGAPVTSYQVNSGDGWHATQINPPGLGRMPAATRKRLCRGGCSDFYGYLANQTPGSTVELRVRALNRVGAGAPSNTLSDMVHGTPSAPTNVSAVGDDGTITTTFSAPEDEGASVVTGYQISYDAGATWSDPELPAGNAPWSVTKTGLENGTTHLVWVRAVNADGSGPFASSSALVATVPGAPTLDEPELDGDDATLTFHAPEDNGGSEVTSYQLSVDNGDTYVTYTPDSTDPDVFHADLPDLDWGKTYGAHVRAVNARGHGEWSNLQEVVATTVPGAPGPIEKSVDGSTVTLTFDAPTFDGGTDITGYEVKADDGDFEPATTTGTGPLRVDLTNQTAGTHTYAVRAVNAVGSGESTEVTDVEVVVAAQPHWNYGYTTDMINGEFDISWNDGSVDPSTVTGWELSVNNGPWLPLSVSYTSPGSDPGLGHLHLGHASESGCPSMGGQCSQSTTARVRAVTTSGRSEASEPDLLQAPV